VLRLAASVEQQSEHPLAAAIVRASEARGLPPAAALDFEAIPGRARAGASAVEGRRRHGGAARGGGVVTDALATTVARRREAGETVVFVAVDGKLAAVLALSDPIKPTAAEALAALRAEQIDIVMLTGRRPARRPSVSRTRSGSHGDRRRASDRQGGRRPAAGRGRPQRRHGRRRRERRTGARGAAASASRWVPGPTSRSRART
jgi:Cu+-exporting ATPase